MYGEHCNFTVNPTNREDSPYYDEPEPRPLCQSCGEPARYEFGGLYLCKSCDEEIF